MRNLYADADVLPLFLTPNIGVCVRLTEMYADADVSHCAHRLVKSGRKAHGAGGPPQRQSRLAPLSALSALEYTLCRLSACSG